MDPVAFLSERQAPSPFLQIKVSIANRSPVYIRRKKQALANPVSAAFSAGDGRMLDIWKIVFLAAALLMIHPQEKRLHSGLEACL